jgi:hypothetical protein
VSVISNVRLNRDRELLPGTEIFRSDRVFLLEAYSGSYRQLLSPTPPNPVGRTSHCSVSIPASTSPPRVT